MKVTIFFVIPLPFSFLFFQTAQRLTQTSIDYPRASKNGFVQVNI